MGIMERRSSRSGDAEKHTEINSSLDEVIETGSQRASSGQLSAHDRTHRKLKARLPCL